MPYKPSRKNLQKTIEQMKRDHDALSQPETLKRIALAVRKELGEDFNAPTIATGMIMAAGYLEMSAIGGLMNHNNVKGWFTKGAKVHGCQCDKCRKQRAEATASADEIIKNAMGK